MIYAKVDDQKKEALQEEMNSTAGARRKAGIAD